MSATSHDRDQDAGCRRCGSPIQDAPRGLCPRCLMAGIMEPTQAPRQGDTGVLPPIDPAELAPHFPQLEILECLGRGGMGVVYKARQKSLDRLVALKLIAPERAGDAGFAARFAREARALASLSHPNIVAVHDSGEAGGFFYLLMEYVDGVNLRQLLQSRRLSPAEALSIVPPVCAALQCAHARGVVHRDIKPENLLMDKAGTVKIADFGIAKMVAAPEGPVEAEAHPVEADGSMAFTFACGTPDYAAPEQREPGGPADHRADIYSLGVVLYEMLTGERPKTRIEPPSRRVQVDVRIDGIVLRALERTPELRFATAGEFGTRVDEVRRGPVVRPRRHPGVRRAAGLVMAVLVTGAVVIAAVSTQSFLSPSPVITKVGEKDPLTKACDELEEVTSALLNAEKEGVLDAADPRPLDARRLRARQERAINIRALSERERQTRRLIQTLSGDEPDAPAATPTTNNPKR